MSSTPPLLPAEIFRYFLKVGYVASSREREQFRFIWKKKKRKRRNRCLLDEHVHDPLTPFTKLSEIFEGLATLDFSFEIQHVFK